MAMTTAGTTTYGWRQAHLGDAMHAGLTLFRAPLAVLGLLMGLAVSGCTTTATVGATAKGLQQQADAVLAPPTLEDWLRPQAQSSDACVVCLQLCCVTCAEIAVATSSASVSEAPLMSEMSADTSDMSY